MSTVDWEISANRFVAFFDILGFKEMVQRNSHEAVIAKLEGLTKVIDFLENDSHYQKITENLGISAQQVRSITFSDSIIFFSKGDSHIDATKILLDCTLLLITALKSGVAIKGAISFGFVTVDFSKSLFFGQPIIDAFLLHEDLKMLTCIADHHFDNKIFTFPYLEYLNSILVKYPAKMKTGNILHTLFKPIRVNEYMEHVKSLYGTVSGPARIYLDNTLEFLDRIS